MLNYLVAAIETPQSTGRIIEIGGSDVITYGDMMLGYAQVRGLRRWMLSVPVLTPRLSSYWVYLVTPIPANIARPLIAGLRNEVIVRDETARQLFPQIKPMDYPSAVSLALADLEAHHIETSWSDVLVTSQGLWVTFTLLAALITITTLNRKALDVFALLGFLVWISGFAIEVVADAQKAASTPTPITKASSFDPACGLARAIQTTLARLSYGLAS